MESMVSFFEKQLNKKIKLVKLDDQSLDFNQNVVEFDGIKYLIELIDNNTLGSVDGFLYLIHQQNLDECILRKVLLNLYEDISIITYKNYFFIKSSKEIDINSDTPEIIEYETYNLTYIVSLGKVSSMSKFDMIIELINNSLPIIISEELSNKHINLNNLIMYSAIHSVSENKNLFNFMNFDIIKNMSEDLLYTGLSFIENDLNISKTSSALFLHRNTLLYRLDKIKKLLNLDLRNFNDSFVFFINVKSFLMCNK